MIDCDALRRMDSHQLINQTSLDTEIFTPPEIVEAWWDALGTIDLDPASCERANTLIRAKAFYTEPEFDLCPPLDGLPVRRYRDWGGLAKDWRGRVVLNPPFGTPEVQCKPGCTKKRCQKRGWHLGNDMPGMPHWVNHFIGEYTAGRTTEGLMICFAATSEGWFKPLLRYPQCFLHGRTNYVLPDGTRYQGATKGSCVTYLGPNVDRFAEVFGKLGTVKVPFVPKVPVVTIPVIPPEGLLESMATRADHSFGMSTELTDEQIEQARNGPDGMEAIMARQWMTTSERRARLTEMAQIHEEVVGKGFYRYGG